MVARGRPPKPKPDKEWLEAELARLDRETAHFEAVGSNLAEISKRLAAELRAAKDRNWRPDKPWATWRQRGEGLLHASTFDPLKARQLALMLAVGDVSILLATRAAGEDATDAANRAALSCKVAAETCGKTNKAKPLAVAIKSAAQKVDDFERLDRSIATRHKKLDLLTTALATGVSIDTLIVLYAQTE